MPSVRVALLSLFVLSLPAIATAQSEARQRQAAAEAYDQGTTAYLAGDYEKAAQWFETANRMSPAAPALIQAARAHQQAGHAARAATLALALVQTYSEDATAVEFGNGVLNALAGGLVRVDVSCEGCSLDVDGTLHETPSFFVDPDTTHNVTASFETGDQVATVSGSAGESKTLSFEAPPPPPAPPPDDEDDEDVPVDPRDDVVDEGGKPLPPVVTYVGVGITAVLLVASIVSTSSMLSGVEPYEKAADAYTDMCEESTMPPAAAECDRLYAKAKKLLDDGEKKETLTTVLWIGTGVAGVATAVLALTLTDWSGDDDESAEDAMSTSPRLSLHASRDGALMSLKGRF
jgi:tetratricopeptide (TPR) repeat protein